MMERIVFHSILGGLTALIPVPWVDDWAGNWVRRRMVRELFQQRGIPLEEPVLRSLVPEGTEPSRGCLYQALWITVVLPFRLAVYLLRRVLRTILFFIAAKQAADRMSRIFHEGYLLDASLRHGWLGEAVTVERSGQVRAACSEVLAEVNTSPVTSVFRQLIGANRETFLRAAAAWRKALRRDATDGTPVEAALGEEDRLLGRLVRLAGDLLGGQRDYLKGVEAQLGSRLSGGPPTHPSARPHPGPTAST